MQPRSGRRVRCTQTGVGTAGNSRGRPISVHRKFTSRAAILCRTGTREGAPASRAVDGGGPLDHVTQRDRRVRSMSSGPGGLESIALRYRRDQWICAIRG
ncbi:hypothetical protein HMPREF0321_1671 [Dermacoccus sp. Ellin185]|nr:hypothetical protein HMPREF0321_1671 [Dermacoccus sp. Ellin185]